MRTDAAAPHVGKPHSPEGFERRHEPAHCNVDGQITLGRATPLHDTAALRLKLAVFPITITKYRAGVSRRLVDPGPTSRIAAGARGRLRDTLLEILPGVSAHAREQPRAAERLGSDVLGVRDGTSDG